MLALALVVGIQAQVGRQQGLLDANTVAEKELAGLPHLTPELAKEIVAQRPFPSITNLNALLTKRLKPEQLTELYRKAFVHVNLNTATREELLLIPGLGKRMAHEFKEYRPYKSMEQFRKEIGKYVNQKELARLERFVTVD